MHRVDVATFDDIGTVFLLSPDPPPMLAAVAQAALESDLAGKVHVLASDPKGGLAAALARLGRAFMARNT